VARAGGVSGGGGGVRYRAGFPGGCTNAASLRSMQTPTPAPRMRAERLKQETLLKSPLKGDEERFSLVPEVESNLHGRKSHTNSNHSRLPIDPYQHARNGVFGGLTCRFCR
jgi:hypothetical protein